MYLGIICILLDQGHHKNMWSCINSSSNLSLILIGAFSVNALIGNDVKEGIIHVASLAGTISIGNYEVSKFMRSYTCSL